MSFLSNFDGGARKELCPSPLVARQANVADPDLTCLELYRILLNQMQYEEKLKKQFEKFLEETNAILDQRKIELENSCLEFHIFDSLRNKGARTKRLQQLLPFSSLFLLSYLASKRLKYI
ncbi:hypothetical protein FF38_09662 [Lucilia cuprina]|uniref:Uncharacterized protein n=1 Tax=Lucilia cuprina TaxID=7375 RepID=A0A0L0BX84_LUCCU|nr:hypothetical protein FF38_09662 [Lucilia cuprina]